MTQKMKQNAVLSLSYFIIFNAIVAIVFYFLGQDFDLIRQFAMSIPATIIAYFFILKKKQAV